MLTWNWQTTEFLLKGVYLGLLVTIAIRHPSPENPLEVAYVGIFVLAGLLLFLGMAAYQKIREGYRVGGRWLGFLIFLLLENPGMVYAGLLVGLSVGTWQYYKLRPFDPAVEEAFPLEAVWPVLGGAVLGLIFYAMRFVRQPLQRFGMSLAMLAILVGGTIALYYFRPELFRSNGQDHFRMIGILLLVGIPGFYLLTFAGMVEESEIEIGAMCAALGIGLWAVLAGLSPTISGAVVVLVPLTVFFMYTTRVMPSLRVFKHALRGMSYRHMGQTKLALISLGRALQLAPDNPLARQQLWDIHRDLNFAELKNQPEIVPFLNFNFCLGRISQVLQTKPDAADLVEVRKMLDIIAQEQPDMLPICSYWRAVACLHERHFDEAARQLNSILQLPQYYTPQRQGIHYAAWQLALVGHPEMHRLVAAPLLAQPGHHMDIIAAVEYQLTLTPQDPTAWDLKRQMYSELTEREYWSLNQPGQPPTTRFNHEYVEQLGLALLDDPQQFKRGCEYLRIAAHGLPAKSAQLYIQIGQTHEKHKDLDAMWVSYQKAMQIGRATGVDSFAPADKEALFAAVKKIGELAIKHEKTDVALEAFKFYSQHESAGIETYRILAQLFEHKQDIWQALHCTEHALSYNAEDKDLLARKDRYYYSIMPEDLKARLESVNKWFDPEYCKTKAQWIVEKFNGDFELLDWAAHLTELAIVAHPGSIAARLLKARIHRLRGEIPEAIEVLELVRQNRPEKFGSADEEKAWYYVHRLLGDLYLDEKPAEAIACYLEFRKSDDSGADTSYKMGRAFEALGDFARAASCYEAVVIFEQHPLYYEARDALDRVKRGAPA
jgi:tetratricopeptide (TPR) repeat protein